MKQLKFLISMSLLLMILVSGCSNQAEQETIKVAYVSSLSGDAGSWGQSLQKGFDFAVEEINNNGGIEGKQIEVVYEDDQCDATTALTVYNKVIDVDDVDFITGTVCSSVAMAVANKVQDNNVVYIASGATHPDVVKMGDGIFRLWVSDAYESKAITKYAFEELGIETISIAHVNDNPAGIAIKENVEETAKLFGEVLSVESYTSEEKDFKTTISKLTENNPDGVYIMAVPEQMPLIVNKLRESNYEGKILLYGPSALSEGVEFNEKEGLYYPQPITQQITDFWTNYETSKNSEADVLVALGYDSMKLIETGLIQCGEDTDCVKKHYLTLKDYETSRGKISFDENGDLDEVDFEIKMVE